VLIIIWLTKQTRHVTGQFGYGGVPGCWTDPVSGYQMLSLYFYVSQVSRQAYIKTMQPTTNNAIGSPPKLFARMAGSQGFYPSYGILRMKNITGNNIFKKLSWAYFWCNFLRFLHYAFDRLDTTAERIPMIFLRFSSFFLTQMGRKVYFVNFFWKHHKGQGILWWFGKWFAVIQEIIIFGIDIYRQFPHHEIEVRVRWTVSGARSLDRLKSGSKRDTNETPTCGAYARPTNGRSLVCENNERNQRIIAQNSV